MYGPRPEQTLLQAPGILITTSRMVLGQHTTPISAVVSVYPMTNPVGNGGYMFLSFIVAGVGVAPSVIAHMLGELGVGFVAFTILLLAIAMLIGVLAARMRPTYGVMVALLPGGVARQIYTSPDQRQTMQIVAALNQALAMR